jgi:DNA-binding response OmpR family regulator
MIRSTPVEDGNSRPSPPLAPDVARKGNGTPRRILIVEDSYLMSDVLADLVRDLGMAPVGPASTLGQAMMLATAEPFDAALVDLRLRHETSVPLCRLLLARSTPFIVVTGATEVLPAELDGIPVIRKPYVPLQLIGRLEGLFEGDGACHAPTGHEPP